jgi:predicted MFS family arabinose efflux permease
VLLQIPAGWFAARWGSKRLISCQCLVISAVLVALPAAARRGAWAAAACIFAFGLAQAPFSVGTPHFHFPSPTQFSTQH